MPSPARRAVLAAALLFAIGPTSASAGVCWADCMAAGLGPVDSDRPIRELARACRTACDERARDIASRLGVAGKLSACRPQPLTPDEFRQLRAANPSFRLQTGVFSWEITNVFSAKALVRVEFANHDAGSAEQVFTSGGLILPGTTGTFVIPAVTDSYPFGHFTGRVVEVAACDLH
ncbi:MAG TPA: hypothetical protein VLA00_01955 [Xanthobacteraceae bacterium]|nr:hypothetical protein [Xanthobacteraceae bacterium]